MRDVDDKPRSADQLSAPALVGPIGSALGFVGGSLGGIFGKSKQKKADRKRARDQARDAFDQAEPKVLLESRQGINDIAPVAKGNSEALASLLMPTAQEIVLHMRRPNSLDEWVKVEARKALAGAIERR